MKTRLAALTFVALAAVAPSAPADETTYCNQMITSLPYTINVQGHYCFNRNLSTAITTGNAITVNADFVLIDLNNFKLGGGSAGLATLANGIYATGRSNITVRNGNIRGFHAAVRLEGGDGHLIENLLVDFNTVYGIKTEGDGTVVRNNIVLETGGSTAGPSEWVYAIQNWPGAGLTLDNFVIGFTPVGSGGTAASAQYYVGVVKGNVVEGDWNIGVIGGVCRDNIVQNANVDVACDLAFENNVRP